MKRLIGLLLAACASPASAYGIPAILPVYAVSAGASGVTVRVPPAGCTLLKSDLTVAIAKTQDRPLLLIARKHPDDGRVCRAAAPAAITWSFEDLGLAPAQPFSLANPLIAEPSEAGK